MPKDESSVAPKEMVNIRLPAPSPGAEGEELPLRLAVIGDFTGEKDDTPVAKRKLRNINQKNFNEIMSSMNIKTSFSVKNKVGGREDEEIPVDLKVDSMKSFRPEQVAKQVPQVRDLVDKLKELNDVLARLGMDKSGEKAEE